MTSNSWANHSYHCSPVLNTFLLVCGNLGAGGQKPNDRFFEDLLHWREQFETVLEEPAEEIGYTHVTSEMLGGAHSDALYPLGSASERYVLFFKEMSSGGTLIYQKRQGGHAFVKWHLPIVPAKKKGFATGTVRKYLQSLGFAVSPRAPLTSTMRRQLSAKGHFASYSFHPEMGGYANVVKPDGTCTKTHRTPNAFSITPEEKALLKSKK